MLARIKNRGHFNIEVEAYKTLPLFDETKTYDITIKEKKNRRSIDQNKLLWKLIGELAKTQDTTDWEMYLNIMKDCNISPEYILALPKAEKTLKEVYRVVIPLDETREVNGKTLTIFKCQIGSSKLDKEQFTQVIEYTIRLATGLGIEIKE